MTLSDSPSSCWNPIAGKGLLSSCLLDIASARWAATLPMKVADPVTG